MRVPAMVLVLSVVAGCAVGPNPPQVTGNVHSAVNWRSVKLYVPSCKPANYDVVAKLDTSKLGVNSSYDFNLNWINQLRKQSAALGADRILLKPTSPAAVVGNVHHGPAFNARAIRLPESAGEPASDTMWASACSKQDTRLFRYKVMHEGVSPAGVSR